MAKLKRTKRSGKLEVVSSELHTFNIQKVLEPVFKALDATLAKLVTEIICNALDGAWIDIEDETGNCEIVLDFLDKKGNPVSYAFNIMDIFHDSEEDEEYGEVDAVKVLRNLANTLEKKRG